MKLLLLTLILTVFILSACHPTAKPPEDIELNGGASTNKFFALLTDDLKDKGKIPTDATLSEDDMTIDPSTPLTQTDYVFVIHQSWKDKDKYNHNFTVIYDYFTDTKEYRLGKIIEE